MTLISILVAEDEQIERNALVYILHHSNLPVDPIYEAANGRQAVAAARKNQPDIIIMDIKMPGLDGLDAACQIKEVNPNSKIIFLTAYSYFDYAQKAIKIGVEDFIIKPVSSEKLIEVLQKIIDRLDEQREQVSKHQETEIKLQKVTQYFENEILSSMIVGDIEEERIDEYIEHLGITFGSGVTCMLTIANGLGSKNEALGDWKPVQFIRQILSHYRVKYLLSQQQNRIYLLLIFTKVESGDLLQSILGELETFIAGSPADIGMGVSKPFNRMPLVTKSFFQARIAGNSSHRGITQYSEFLEDKGRHVNYPLEIEKLLYEKLAKGDREGTLSVFHDLWEWIVENSETFEVLTEWAYRLIIIVQRWVSEEFNIEQKMIYPSHNDLKTAAQINDLKASCWNILVRLLEQIQEGMKEPSALIIEDVCNYIGENYMKEITLDKISSMVGFSRFYFSKIFKQYKGLNFIDYVTSVRIKRSKELLKNVKITIKDISYQVGYSDPNYYTSVFKKTEGIAPTEYRNKCL